MKHDFKNLMIWQRSRALVKQIYEITAEFPTEERFGLAIQMRRSAVSIPSNIAEGCGRYSNKQLKHFLEIATGSACELETQLYLAIDLDFFIENDANPLISELTELRKMISGFSDSLTSDF